jgi:DNA-binding CsgD family transcriptional regulator
MGARKCDDVLNCRAVPAQLPVTDSAVAANLPMNNSEFDTLVADFYRAATGSLPWDRALDGVQAAFGARAAVLHTLDIGTGRLLGLSGGGPDLREVLFNYTREYHLIDPRRQRVLQRGVAGVGHWNHDHEHFDPSFVAKDRFYQQFLPAYDARYNANVVIALGDNVLTGFAMELPARRGPLDADEREHARRLGEHLRDALLAHQRVRSLMQQALAGHGLLNSFPYPMWLMDEDRFVSFSNPAAGQEIEQGTRVALRGAHLALVNTRQDRQLTERLHRLSRSGHGASTVVDLRSTAADPPTWLQLSLLVPGAVLGAFGNQPQVLATLFDPRQVSSLDPFALASIFGLTPAEAKVAVRLADGLSAQEIGQSHGTAEATVRSQIRQVLLKLGAQRSVDVVRLLRQGEALWAQAGSADAAG